MKDLTIFEQVLGNSRIFKDAKLSTSILCAYRDNYPNCSPDCAACEINQESMMTTATCLRGSFVFGQIKNLDS